MKYSSQHYARALVEVLDAIPARERTGAIRRFVGILARRGALASLGRILNECEKLLWRRSGRRKVEIQSTTPLDASVRRAIRRSLGKDIVAVETVRPEILGGMRIIIDDEILIDASAKQSVDMLFGARAK